MTRSAKASSRWLLLGRLKRLEIKPTVPEAAYRQSPHMSCPVTDVRKLPLISALTYLSIFNAGLVKPTAGVSQRLVHNEGFHEALRRVPKGSRQSTDDLEAE
jgi:hypothetical protein